MADHISIATALSESNNLTDNLRKLMQIRNISEAELARQTRIPQPTLHKILAGITNDPRTSTLKALAEFFHIQIDILLSSNYLSEIQHIVHNNKIQSIPIISWSECIKANQITKSLMPANWDKWVVTEFLTQDAYALSSKPFMEPRFPKGCILVIDPSIYPEDGDYVIVHYPNTEEATMRELSIDGPSKLLLTICRKRNPTQLDNEIKIIGVLVKSVFSFH